MQTYLVGGAVRDRLLGETAAERDWVVVGATPAAMEQAGFRRVGRNFPVFLHPETQEEYALARTERKTGPGYRGFEFCTDPDVTLRKLADALGITPNHLSQAMNQILQKNYYEFINGYRIEDAKIALSDAANTKKAILEIAFDVGFKSKSVFNTVFKDLTGMTPSQFRQQNKTV